MASKSDPWYDLIATPMRFVSTIYGSHSLIVNAHTVIARRLAIVGEALICPRRSGHSELNLMVSEKVAALKVTGRLAFARTVEIHDAYSQQGAALGRFAGQGWCSPLDPWEFTTRNVAIVAQVLALPGEMLKPYQIGVAVNAKRLAVRRALKLAALDVRDDRKGQSSRRHSAHISRTGAQSPTS